MIEDGTAHQALERLIAGMLLHDDEENLRRFHSFSLFSIRKI